MLDSNQYFSEEKISSLPSGASNIQEVIDLFYREYHKWSKLFHDSYDNKTPTEEELADYQQEYNDLQEYVTQLEANIESASTESLKAKYIEDKAAATRRMRTLEGRLTKENPAQVLMVSGNVTLYREKADMYLDVCNRIGSKFQTGAFGEGEVKVGETSYNFSSN
ncbi:hypothetical protein V6R21_22810 [Limibacter armeniacum]|uniref:hypothetical protein n=1 Tax=Limibacter armeniacum TaxID=466084 RepID=UPI002FE57700